MGTATDKFLQYQLVTAWTLRANTSAEPYLVLNFFPPSRRLCCDADFTMSSFIEGNVKNGFIAQFIPNAMGLHVVLVEYNGVAVGGTPFYSKAGHLT